MDPLSIAAGVTGLLGAATSVSKTLTDLKGKYSRSDSTFTAISTECTIISSTLSQVARIAKQDFSNFSDRLSANDTELRQGFQEAIDCCDVTLVALSDTLSKCTRQGSQGLLSWRGKARLLFSEQELRDRLQTLRSLNVAMGALLSAIQADTVSSMNQILSRNFGANKSIRKETGTLKQTYTPSIISGGETVFEFDDEIVNSAAYRRAFQSFKASKGEAVSVVTENPNDLSSLTLNEAQSKPSVPVEKTRSEPALASRTTEPSKSVTATPPLQKSAMGAPDSQEDPVPTSTAPKEQSSAMNSTTVQQPREETPLYNAAKEGHYEVVRLLLGRGVEAKLPRTNGFTPVNAAAWNGHLKVVEALLNHGVDVSVPDNDGGPPLYWAAQKGHDEIVALLLSYGAEANLPRVNGYTPLGASAFNGHSKVVQMLIKHGVEINTPCNEGGTPLYWAATNGHAETLQILLAAGAEANQQRIKGFTPVNGAAWKGHLKCVELLVDHGVDITIPENDGGQPLYWAATNGFDQIVTFLLERGAEYKLPRVNNFTPMSAAAFKGHTKVIEVLLNHDPNVT